jgi:alpha-D-xyloside xylohydrolase
VFELEDGQRASAVVYNLDGTPEMEILVVRNGKYISIATQGVAKNWSLLFRGIWEQKQVNGGSAIVNSLGLLLQPDQSAAELHLEL